MSGRDDGSRTAAVRELGEEAVRAAELAVVKANADRLSIATFRAMGIPPEVIGEALGLVEPAAAAVPRGPKDGPDSARQGVSSPRPALMPPDLRALRPEARSIKAQGRSALGPGVPL
ncbi:uncharacterized protein PD653_2194 [Nocardioides sp. PD653]|nr:uncharacterized protein PD653_2194 [Nocardioides sp. PD653]